MEAPLLPEDGHAGMLRPKVQLRSQLTRATGVSASTRKVGALILLPQLALLIGFCYSFTYIYVVDEGDLDLEDKAGGWAGDFLLALAALLFALSSKILVPDKFVTFYLGTAAAYGLGGAGHFLEDNTTPVGLTAYFVIMTLAFGGDALRSGYGYALDADLSTVRIQKAFTAITFLGLCLAAAANLQALLHGVPATRLKGELLGRAYVSFQIGMGFVEITGSLVWYKESHKEVGVWGLIAACANISAWLLVRNSSDGFCDR
eukprot:TRINITY_DN10896_c0_g1_i1.p1 TRINITY_DN10896_c0_g1~~TRINITY_DN10896_c0_g1_i1.p1  ORF type:complete len:271 (+),score=21.24 TRINITY_DN10896_c0_g1_i1:35-814(+)